MTNDESLVRSIEERQRPAPVRRISEAARTQEASDQRGSYQSLKRLFPYLSKCRGALALGLLAMATVAILTISFGQVIKWVIDNIPKDAAEALRFSNYVAAITLAVIVIYFLSTFARMYCMRLVAIKVTEELRKDVFKNVIAMGASYIDRHSSGSIQTRIIADTSSLGEFLAKQIPVFVKSSMMLTAALIACFFVNVELATVVLIGVPLTVLPFILASRPLRKLASVWQATIADAGRSAGEIFRRIKAVHVFDQHTNESRRFSGKVGLVAQCDRRVNRLMLFLNALAESLSLACITVLFWFAFRDVFAGRMTLGELISFGFYVQAILIASRNLVDIGSSFHVAAGVASRVVDYLDAKSSVRLDTVPATATRIDLSGSIEFRDVHFAYASRPDTPVLKGVNLTVPPGGKIALVGISGSGKSTLLELLMRIYEPDKGSIVVGGADVRNIPVSELCAAIGYVPQEDFLLSGSVIENIRYGNPEASLDDAVYAARRAHAHGFIEQLPNGYQTDLGEVGSRLSGGQRRRISLARAMLRKPRILLLDEATTALDQESEREVRAALDQVSANATTVIKITHSIRDAMTSDTIAVMDEGRIVAQGTHAGLLASSPVYRRLAAEEEETSRPKAAAVVA
ncbi:ATP-binding cassette domain-containing protein [Steroidobacter sp. S1-65]|uniref:ATP-binding cassette domain-containing protein n=1 Tax=Steroidobacter gossypii TaxID=2805490 RepID=A0ABS1WZZ8_9GAMM|nr:ABC transporter transmembrane domain-containing protein [Steroidobacter gossypii]MBM0106549.1 ATP-binding cassette domain-containing protein [Steroidobacter gossypii]